MPLTHRSVPLLRTLTLAFLLLAGAAASAFASTQFLRRPDVHGDRIVFTSEGDLWLGSISAGTATRLTTDPGTEGPAYFSPDGKRIAFSAQYDGNLDVYVMDAGGSVPKRLTWDPTGATALGWSADGREVLFRSRRFNGVVRRARFWAVPATGGAPRLLPIPYGEFAKANADGRRIAYVPVSAEWMAWKRYKGGQADDVWLADTVAHTFQRLTNDPGIDTEPQWVGNAIVFVSERDGRMNLWRLDPASRAATAITRYTDYAVRYPGTDGQRVVFEHGDGLAMWDAASGAVTELKFDLHSDRIHARAKQESALKHLFGVTLGPTGKRVLVSARGQVLSAPVENGEVRTLAAPAGARAQYPAWSPDGKRFAFVCDATGEEQIWIGGTNGGEAKALTKDHVGPLGPIRWSPDGKWLVTSDREMRILLADAATGAWTTVDQFDRGGSYDLVLDHIRFSPDGKWLAYARQEPNWNWAIWLYDIAAKKGTRVTSTEMDCDSPSFDPEGKYLVWLADRAFDPFAINATRGWALDKYTKVSLAVLAADGRSPFLPTSDEEGAGDAAKPDAAAKPGKDKGAAADAPKEKPLAPTRIDLAGLAERIVDVPAPADHYVRVEAAGGRLLLLVQGDAGDGPAVDAREIRAFDMKKKSVDTVVKKATSFELSADGKKLLVRAGKAFHVIDADASSLGEKGKLDTDGWTVTVDVAAEWTQILHETWRIGRDFFYDPKLHGVDWNAVRTKYEAMIPAIADRSDLSFVQAEMVAELDCGHAYIRGGDNPEVKPLPMGWLGADYEFVPGAVPAYRVTRVLAGDGFDLELASPLLAPGVNVRPGEYLLAIDGQPVRADAELQSLLVGKADRVVRLTVNTTPTLAGARDVRVKPLAGERQLRFEDWVMRTTEYVRRNGGENFGYVHIPNMGTGGLTEWAKHYYPQLQKDAIVYDVRWNGGGFIDALLLLQAGNKPYTWFKPRFGASWTRQDWAFAGHAAALCNENSFSDAEEFSDAFQRLKLGPVFGVPTGGAEVGSGEGYPMIDGGLVYVPNYGEWVDGQWVIEGPGVQPDVLVEDDPAALLAGRDPQLDRAIQYLKDKLAKEPVVRPVPPPYPNKALK